MCTTLQISWKLPGRPSVAMAVGHNNNRLLYARNHVSRRRFLVDTGADKLSSNQGAKLTAANGSCIRTFGKRTIPLQFNKRHFQWTFTVAEVSQPLLGADFLRAHSILVDVKGQRLIDSSDFTSIGLHSTTTAAPHLDSIASADDEFAKLLAQFPEITTPSFHNPTPKHGVELFIPTKGPPVHARARRLPPDKLQIAKEKFRKMEEMRRSNSQWS